MKLSNFSTHRLLDRGFGLLEVVVASGILMIVIGSSVTLSRMAIKNSVISLERVQAYNLAQEGMEKMRQIRDSNWIDNNSSTQWNDQLVSKDETIVLDNKNFQRVITISDVSDSELSSYLESQGITQVSDSIKKISVRVSWQEYDLDWNVEIISYLSDWRPRF
ncbi:hypothetical protein A3F08_01095 [Candidatus Berkelbacteria bacterium RIFCSPHIGHO2_12_FULL_36_9]|uniref:Type IV pilus modification protein PilV n=1 Tax=Candidatus Berkelbacteria bacterium RIFCSPHIGHO2_12_FULL_36_9 TaxID=1797469 RepID=A0A1F5EE36_9BACT|nr:MAG: hypothetical protein A3F08_01095 [Candidatus Berkelbacteria bacterium RIFCSPHIGHO2_12_FULL_36_9]